MDFGFVGHCKFFVCRPTHLSTLLLNNIVSVANYPPPISVARILHCEGYAVDIACEGGVSRFRIRRHLKASLNLSLYMSVPSYKLGKR